MEELKEKIDTGHRAQGQSHGGPRPWELGRVGTGSGPEVRFPVEQVELVSSGKPRGIDGRADAQGLQRLHTYQILIPKEFRGWLKSSEPKGSQWFTPEPPVFKAAAQEPA